jgi:hypothetical protein
MSAPQLISKDYLRPMSAAWARGRQRLERHRKRLNCKAPVATRTRSYQDQPAHQLGRNGVREPVHNSVMRGGRRAGPQPAHRP